MYPLFPPRVGARRRAALTPERKVEPVERSQLQLYFDALHRSPSATLYSLLDNENHMYQMWSSLHDRGGIVPRDRMPT